MKCVLLMILKSTLRDGIRSCGWMLSPASDVGSVIRVCEAYNYTQMHIVVCVFLVSASSLVGRQGFYNRYVPPLGVVGMAIYNRTNLIGSLIRE